MRHIGNMGDIVYFFGQCCCWVTGSHWSRGSHCVFVGQFCFCDFFFWVTGSRWSRGSRDVFLGKICFWVTGSRGYTKLGHVCDPEDYRTQIHTDTQNLVTYVTRATKGHRVTLVTWITLCFLSSKILVTETRIHTDTQNWVTYVTRETIGHRYTQIHKIWSHM